MGAKATLTEQETPSRTLTSWLFVFLVGTGFFLRVRLAWLTFLNPDEALHYFLSRQPSLKFAYAASLPTAHPPLMILFLHYWSFLARNELFLRLPFVIAGILFSWLMFLWIRRVANTQAAWFALILFLFLQSLISLTAEVRQYSFLLLFCAISLYSLERALEDGHGENSVGWISLSAVALYLALLTHYSAMIFAAAVGIYGLLCQIRTKSPKLVAAWLAVQTGALVICGVLYQSQISKLRSSGVPTEIGSTWLRSSIFQPGQDHLAIFAWTKTLRVFRYFFSHGTIGVVGFGFFVFAIVVLLWPDDSGGNTSRKRGLAILLALPFLITLAVAIAGIYPYGGTRHDALLALFAIPGIAIGLDRLPIPHLSKFSHVLKSLLLGAAVLICNLFPSPSGPYIQPKNHRRELMAQAISYVRSLPPDSVVLTDAQGSMVLNYYLCDEAMRLPFKPENSLFKLRCGDFYVLTSMATQTGFDRATFPDLLASAQGKVRQETTLYLFQSGWIDNKEENWLNELRGLNGDPRNFGPNVLICPIRRTKTTAR